MEKKYIFKSERLGFRNWIDADIDKFAELNVDEEVMEYFPSTLSQQETIALIERLKKQFEDNGFTYYATEILETGEFIGMIGLALQEYKTSFTPAVDIGWRLKKEAWGNGYATEGAQKCLEYGFNNLNINRIIAVCTVTNKKSEKIMQKIGMTKQGTFKHPKLVDFPEYENCFWYEILKKNDN